MLSLRRYTAADRELWDSAVAAARNATFLFLRRYMDYHSDRFRDHSLIFCDGRGTPVALLPANESVTAVGSHTERHLHSHQGLTYGGFILSPRCRDAQIEELFRLTVAHLRDNGFAALHYKQVPHTYHLLPSDNDAYWLWRLGATEEACCLSSTIDLHPLAVRPHVSGSRRNNANRLRRHGYTVLHDTPLHTFWPILTANLLASHGVAPVHTLEEMQRLQAACPDNILCHTVADTAGHTVAGTVLFVTPQVVHAQYISASPEGKACGALDLLFLTLIEEYRQRQCHRYFDFGISNERGGTVLNASLLEQKEGFGATGTLHRSFLLRI